ncbi:GNAT family N-acetyltransferase [Fusibacter sp. JL216-2]|uniref:GNAT family N-acetyltransferase n=1 Tax=Fusibacter sp. JL216-2 TaxID=3071453 RepID=UPI003D32E3F2
MDTFKSILGEFMNGHVLNTLYENKINHAYVIKALEDKMATTVFEFRSTETPELSYAAIWHEDNIVSLFGDKVWCQECFHQYLGYYSFYDIDPGLMEALCADADMRRLSNYDLENHYLMRLDHNGIKEIVDRFKALNRGDRCIKEVKTIQNTTRYQYLERDGRILGSVLLEKITENVFVISEMLIKKPFRDKGFAFDFISRLLGGRIPPITNGVENEIILHVDVKNTPALKLYKKLGFKKVGAYQNLVHKDD